jgi:regulator of sigma E protease
VNLIESVVEKGRRTYLVSPRIPALIGEVQDSSPAKIAGLKFKDEILGVNDQDVRYVDQLRAMIQQHKGDSLLLKVRRENRDTVLHARVSQEGTLGFYFYPLTMEDLQKLSAYDFEYKNYSFFASFPAGVRKAGEKLNSYIQQFKMILNPKTGAYKGLSGFKGMASIFPNDGWDWEAFWNITAFFSIVLAFMNLLPIPALDGGHVLFTLIEMITGKRPSDKFLEYAQIVGMVLLLGLMLYANGNDWFGWGRHK